MFYYNSFNFVRFSLSYSLAAYTIPILMKCLIFMVILITFNFGDSSFCINFIADAVAMDHEKNCENEFVNSIVSVAE